MNDTFAMFITGSFVAARLAISPIRILAWYESRARRASVAFVSDMCRTSASLLNRTDRTDESSLSVPELRSTISRSGVFTGTYVGLLCKNIYM